METPELPIKIAKLLERQNAPERLKRHLRIVHMVAFDLLSKLKEVFPLIPIYEKLVLFGAATHDIGKIVVEEELYRNGNKHEVIGMKMLISFGFSEAEARFAKTHGNWIDKDLEIEDLLVCLSDKIWKGKRILELEELICKRISIISKQNYWSVYVALDSIIERIALGADQRIAWQGY